ncbi:hypothetical protein J4401_07215 [Candidatus Woesearchaeota archaeon]|nr:hypothetical protein [Candidatus Woesearchaeota archaeon]
MAKVADRELREIVRITAGLERHSEENDPVLDKQVEKAKSIFSKFHEKYPAITLEISNDIQGLSVRIFLSSGLLESYKAASGIKGLSAIGFNGFDEISAHDQEKIARAEKKISKQVFMTYALDIGTETIVLHWSEKKSMTELIYEIKSLANVHTPQYTLLINCMAKEHGKNIDILSDCYQLGFTDIEDEALYEWEDEFYPKILE